MTKTLRELAEKATPGPWEWDLKYDNKYHRDIVVRNLRGNLEDVISIDNLAAEISRYDAKYIAAANPETILKLLDSIDEMRLALEIWDNAFREGGAEHARVRAYINGNNALTRHAERFKNV